MVTLAITIEEITDEDYDGNQEIVKELTATLDGKSVDACMSFETSVSDASCKTQFKDFLTDLEYTWDQEV